MINNFMNTYLIKYINPSDPGSFYADVISANNENEIINNPRFSSYTIQSITNMGPDLS